MKKKKKIYMPSNLDINDVLRLESGYPSHPYTVISHSYTPTFILTLTFIPTLTCIPLLQAFRLLLVFPLLLCTIPIPTCRVYDPMSGIQGGFLFRSFSRAGKGLVS